MHIFKMFSIQCVPTFVVLFFFPFFSFLSLKELALSQNSQQEYFSSWRRVSQALGLLLLVCLEIALEYDSRLILLMSEYR